MSIRTFGCALGLMLLSAGAFAADGFREGKWEITTQHNLPMPALPPGTQLPPGFKLPAAGGGVTITRCLKKGDDAANQTQRPDFKCETTKKASGGADYEWTTHCTTREGGSIDGEGKASFTGDTMSSSVHMKGSDHGRPFDMTMNSTGRYLGPCD